MEFPGYPHADRHVTDLLMELHQSGNWNGVVELTKINLQIAFKWYKI